jgi:ribulose-phosphate 3-epimerase
MVKISPSILAADLGHLKDELDKTVETGVEYIHLDIMDGHFVPNLTFGPEMVRFVRDNTDLPLDVHLMISNPLDYLEIYAESGGDIITIHYETVENPEEALETIHEMGRKSGISVSPNTPVEVTFPYLDHSDWLLIMSVHPGFAGQKFMHSSIEKVSKARGKIESSGFKCDIAVDGGIDITTAPKVTAAGADIVITGSSFYSSGDYGEFVKKLRDVTSQ